MNLNTEKNSNNLSQNEFKIKDNNNNELLL
jgi:hypothetical protein